MEEPAIVDWGTGWAPVTDASGLERELRAELSAGHPLAACSPRILGRCLACDDVVVAARHRAGEPELAVVHLTWRHAAEPPPFPYHERVTTAAFVQRFLRDGEHL